MGGERAFKRARSSEPVSLWLQYPGCLQIGVSHFAKSLCNVSLLEGGTTDGTVQIISNIPAHRCPRHWVHTSLLVGRLAPSPRTIYRD